MLKKVWFMFVLWSVLMVSGCSGGMQKENVDSMVVSEIEISEMDVSEETCADISNVGALNTEEQISEEVATKDVDANSEQSTTEASNVPETVETQPYEPQSATPEQTTPTPPTESPATEDSTPPATDDRGNPADGSSVLEITCNIAEAEYVGYDANRVARLAVEKCKVAGMISLTEDLDRLLAEGKITQEEYNEYYPYDSCGYYSVFVETNLNLASTISGRRLCSEEEIADYIAGMMALEVEPYFYIEYAGVYQGNSTEFYEFRCYR